MQPWQSAQLRNGEFIQNQRRNQVPFALLRDKLGWRLRQRQFAEAVLQGNLPERNGAQKYGILWVAHCVCNVRG